MTEQTFDAAFERVRKLVADFGAHEKAYLAPEYKEDSVRKDFIDKFWIALGWDVFHEHQTNPYEQDVKAEKNVEIKGRIKKADYAFLASNFRDVSFFVEAKKPSRNIDNADDYFQTIRYGWNANTTVSILTDFEQFRLLDCRYKPDVATALHRVVKKFDYKDYAEREKFAEIYHLFSREAVSAGALERFAATLPKATGKAVARKLFAGGVIKSVDEDFLAELDELRGELARSFKNRNPQLDGEDLTEATQRTIDRLVFMRFLEDKLIEPEVIVDRLGERGTAWADFVGESQRLDRIYNGIIFKRHEIIDDASFVVDERMFAGVRERLSHTNSPYDFNSLPVAILGSIYERFLGKVIETTDKRANVVEKPEVRKAGGVYYTPEYIVRYIVKETIGKTIAGKTPAEIAVMRFADIACGSGSFLLGVYDELLRYHTGYYNRTKRTRGEALKAGCIEREDGSLALSLIQKREILLNNIYGVDIDAQAVEVAQLSLFLKLLEDETTATARRQMTLKHALLPNLNDNIKCGNSLVGYDILDGHLFEATEERKLNPMDFEAAFPEVMKRGGFDAIVGNPPYGASITSQGVDYLTSKYQFQEYQLDTYFLFVEQSLRLLNNGGLLGYIIPNTWLLNLLTPKIRRHIFANTKVETIVHYQKPVFSQATVDTEVVVIRNSPIDDNHLAHITIIDKQGEKVSYGVKQKRWKDGDGKPVNILIRPEMEELIDKLNRSPKLDDLCAITQGCKPFQVGKGKPPQTRKVVTDKPFVSEVQKDDTFRPLLRGSLIQKYLVIWKDDYWISFGDWLAEPRYSANYDAPAKIVIRQTGDSLVATLDKEQFIVRDNLYTIVPKTEDVNLFFILGLLNSKCLNWYYQNVINPEKGEALAQVKRGHLAQLPIADRARHDRMVSLVDAMLAAKKQLQLARSDKDKDFYANKCHALDRQIDRLVYELYELTAEEIALVEAGA
ncbi:MAG: N-6 DNA methylase [Pyrinomonadaceae bacterium MAG19_C2-C3]|nr:N-6 DNA methylase [Pyrinomonadaceae bacterium MAG19_C2-C3]